MKEHILKANAKDNNARKIAENTNDNNIDYKNTNEKEYQPQVLGRDANSHLIFSNPVLTCQFLKGYTGISLFQNITPEDIEDVSDRYKAFLGVEFEADTVKRIRVQLNGQEKEIYVVSLIEHKSYVDYDIAMQLLRYMTVIWHDYKVKRNKEQKGSSSLKNFRYPLIVPIVYYEGDENWTADMHLLDRIECGEMMKEYVPDFQYKVVRLHDYTNEELQEKNDEMSLVMMINKVQSKEDYQEFLNIAKKVIVTIYQNTSTEIQEIYQEIIWTLLMQMKVPQEQAQEMIEGLEGRGMGYLFENLKGIDIGKMQEESRELQNNIKNMKNQLTDTQSQLTDTQSQLTDTQSQLTDTQKELEDTKMQLEESHNKLIHLSESHAKRMKELGLPEVEAVKQLVQLYDMGSSEALQIIQRCWK